MQKPHGANRKSNGANQKTAPNEGAIQGSALSKNGACGKTVEEQENSAKDLLTERKKEDYVAHVDEETKEEKEQSREDEEDEEEEEEEEKEEARRRDTKKVKEERNKRDLECVVDEIETERGKKTENKDKDKDKGKNKDMNKDMDKDKDNTIYQVSSF